MLFNSFSYLVFLALATVLYFALPQKARWAVLLVFSYYFYMSWNAKLVLIILFTTVTSYLTALAIEKFGSHKKLILALGVGTSFLCLFFFKYFNFLGACISALALQFGFAMQPITLQLILPVGISFYTFQTVSYVVDVYRGKLPVEKHFGVYALYVSFFPQLVAGPIERATNLLPQFYQKHDFDTARCSEGIRKIIVGMFKKVVIADTMAGYVNSIYNNLGGNTGLTLIFATLLFGIQIYCDFSGYSDIAIGSAKILGFTLMENFKAPFLSKSLKEFWRRWHISLSTWFSDYVYIPLGGSRVKKPRYYFNLMLTFFLSGLWHGANYNFVVWGLYNGVILCAESLFVPRLDHFQKNCKPLVCRLINGLRWVYLFVVINIGWVLFRANSMADAGYVLKNLLRGLNPLHILDYTASMNMDAKQLVLVLMLIAVLFLYDALGYYKADGLELLKKKPAAVRYAAYYIAASAILLAVFFKSSSAPVDFIYFQF